MAKTRRASTITSHTVLTLCAMIAALPIVGVILVALEPYNSPGTIDAKILARATFSTITRAWTDGGFGTALYSSALITVGTILLCVVFAVPAAHAFATIRFPGRNVIFAVFVLGLLLPDASILIPLYYESRPLYLTGTPLGVILPSAALSVAFGVFWMRAVFSGIPPELLSAARVDGATGRQVFWRIELPLARSGILVLVLLVFLWTWNSFMLPLVMLTGSSTQTVTMALSNFQQSHTTNVPALAAGALFVCVPVILVYVVAQRHFMRGLIEGGLKV